MLYYSGCSYSAKSSVRSKHPLPPQVSGRHEIERTLDLDKLWNDWLALEGKAWWAANPDESKAKVRKAIDGVRAYRGQLDRANRLSNYDSLNDQYDAALEDACDAKDGLMAMPAPDMAALSWKLEVGFFEDAIGGERFIPAVRADARRLLGKPVGVVGF